MIIRTLLLTFSLLTLQIQANELDYILNNMIKSYGGIEALRKVESYTQKWKVLALQQKIKGEDKRIVILPHTLDTTLTYPNKIERRVITPGERYKEHNGQKQSATGIKLQAMQLQLKRLYTPLILLELKDYLKLEDYNSHYALILSKDNEKTIYFIEKATNIITQVTAIIYANQKITFNTLYTKFKKFNNVLFPTKEYKSTNGIKTAILELEKMIIE